ncbi:hypothetical protein EOB59_34805 [Mesorhizobium sp. M7A.F.Ca.MR.176.00.0.0]|uniref:hypothetical protein n=1 Tax=Mesorhizobium sp. M7A.F.Ca.MR.176.00.0.0 TaxID=2496776 RepID=UPI000FD4D018|nr:hypothetical protein [Mesorhizobium sp. M7A.F.Ca.MR.176.00.0.0]RUU84045.1 hypothetical protein EOB59_34805 [Mesorhizobium sp. M7A.F.Ca.MR.176.00.0.0]
MSVPLESLIERLEGLAEQVTATMELARAMQAEQSAIDHDAKFPPGDLIDVATAANRFRKKPDTLRHWCEHEGMGVKRGARWFISVSLLRKREGY